MPIYEYQCQQCGHQMEALQKISDPPLTDCPQCQQAGLQKLVSAASFRLKGGGWYETDFKSGDKKHLAESDSQKQDSKASDKNGSGDKGKDSDKSKSDGKKASSEQQSKTKSSNSESATGSKPASKSGASAGSPS